MSRHQEMIDSMQIDFTRQRDWYDPNGRDDRVTMVGCGGIGSLTAVLLSKLGIPHLTLIDPDIVEAHNIPNQFFPHKMVGKLKVAVLKAVCMMFGSSNITTHRKRLEEIPDVLHGIVVTGLDSMEARHAVWNIVKRNPKVQYLVDGRLNGLGIVVWCINVHDLDEQQIYEEQALYTDEEADELPCTGRGVIDVSAFVAAINTRIVRMLVTEQKPELVTSLHTRQMKLWMPFNEEDEAQKTTSINMDPEVTAV